MELDFQRAKLIANDENIKKFQKDGAICLKQVLTKDEISLLERGIDLNLQYPSPNFNKASSDSDSGLFVEDFCVWQTNEFYQRFIFNTPLSIIAGLLMESNTSRLYHDHVLIKEPFTQQITPWHQDQPYYNIIGNQNCSFWIPVDKIFLESTLEFVLGSHLGPWLLPRSFQENKAKWFPEGSLEDVPNIQQQRENYNIKGWELDPGDIVCFHMLTLHSSAGVPSNNRRRIYSVRFVGDDVRFVHRNWVTSPPFHGLEKELEDESCLEHPLFPLMWKK